jgi:hypothetical protein
MRVKDDPLYEVWASMRRRCRDPKHVSFKYYGAVGIQVCERWNSFQNFISDMGERPAGMTLDRRDSSGDYTPANCRWATIAQQNSNKGDTMLVEIDGVAKPVAAWARERGISPQVVHYRVRKLGMRPLDALSLPASRKTRHAYDWASIKEIK